MDESSQLPLPMTAATQSHTSSEQNGQRGPRKGEANLQSHSLNYATPSNTAIRAPQTPQRPLNSPIYEVETRKASPSPILTNHLDEGPHGRFYDERQSSIPPKAAPLNGYRASPSRFDPSSPWPSSFETPKNDHGEESPSMLGSGGTAARTGRVIEFLGSELDKSKVKSIEYQLLLDALITFKEGNFAPKRQIGGRTATFRIFQTYTRKSKNNCITIRDYV